MFEKERFEQVDEWGEAPLQEPERQYYYMKKCRQWAQQEEPSGTASDHVHSDTGMPDECEGLGKNDSNFVLYWL